MTPPPTAFPVFFVFAPLAVVLFFALFVWYRVREFRYMVGCVRFGDAAFSSNARLAKILQAVALTVGWFVFLILIFGIVTAVLAAVLGSGSKELGMMALGPFIPLFLILFVLLASPLIIYTVTVFSIVRHAWTTLRVSNPEAFDRAVQATEEGPKFGEGLADAFDVGAF